MKETIIEKWDREASELPIETRQKFLDLMKQGKSLGEAREEAGISDVGLASHIFVKQVNSVQFVDWNAKTL